MSDPKAQPFREYPINNTQTGAKGSVCVYPEGVVVDVNGKFVATNEQVWALLAVLAHEGVISVNQPEAATSNPSGTIPDAQALPSD